MKHWKEFTYRFRNSKGIVLESEERIISISKKGGKILISEECDEAFFTTLTKEEAIEAFEEAIEFIKSDDDNK